MNKQGSNNAIWWLLGLGLLGGGLISLMRQYGETKDKGEDFGWDKIDWGRTGKSALKGVLVVATAGLIVKLIGNVEEEEDFYPSHHLNNVLNQNSLKSNPEILQLAIQKRNSIKEFVSEYYGNQLAGSPLNWGSYAHGTANGSNFDL